VLPTEESVKLFVLLMSTIAIGSPAYGQHKYIDTMKEALGYAGAISGKDCHNLQVDLYRWQTVFIPRETDPKNPGGYLWTVIEVKTIHLYLDLADLDEEKITNQAVFSGGYLKDHKNGAPWLADVPLVSFDTEGLKKFLEADVDLNKVRDVQNGREIKESELGVSSDYKRAALVLLPSQRDADYFKKALHNAIVTCKATN
jgi:hypothetical protein